MIPFKVESIGELLVLDETKHLWGTLDRNDLPEIVARIAVVPLDRRGDAGRRRLSEFLVKNTCTSGETKSPTV